MTSFLNKGYVIATIMLAKYELLNECFVTFKELNIIGKKLQDKFNEINLDICVNTGVINKEHFMVNDDVIILNPDININEIKQLYVVYIPDSIKSVLNNNFIGRQLIDIKKEEIKSLAQNLQNVSLSRKLINKK